MIYSGLRICCYLSLLSLSIFSPVNSLAEPGSPVITEPSRAINSEVLEIEPADEEDDESEVHPDLEQDYDQDEEEKSIFSFLDTPHDYVSVKLESIARSLDEYFTENRDFYLTTGSYLKLRGNIVIKERGLIEKSNSVSFKLRLPNTEKKLKIFFETPAEKQPYDISTQTKETPPTTVSEGDYILGVQGESGERYGWKYKPTLGVNIDSRLDPFARFRVTREYQFVKWNINWQETPYWYDSIGWGVDSYFEINKRISEKHLFRSATFAGWKYDTDNFDLSHVFSLFHTLNDKQAMSYYAGVYGVSKPIVYTTQFLLGITYRQDIYKNYLFFEVEPQIRYQKINRFHPEHSLTFRLEMVFKD